MILLCALFFISGCKGEEASAKDVVENFAKSLESGDFEAAYSYATKDAQDDLDSLVGPFKTASDQFDPSVFGTTLDSSIAKEIEKLKKQLFGYAFKNHEILNVVEESDSKYTITMKIEIIDQAIFNDFDESKLSSYLLSQISDLEEIDFTNPMSMISQLLPKLTTMFNDILNQASYIPTTYTITLEKINGEYKITRLQHA